MTALVVFLYLAGIPNAYQVFEWDRFDPRQLILAFLWPITIPLGLILALYRYFTLL